MAGERQVARKQGRSSRGGAAGAGERTDPAWAWAPFEPDSRRPWTLALAGHLYRRAAFGAGWSELQRALTEGPGRTVDRLLRPEADVAAFERRYDGYEASASDSGSADGLRAWWLRRMIRTPHPLLEKMTLFWHDHFATSNVRVKSALLMRRHVQLLRRHALGNYGALLHDVSRDPAALVSLDARANRRAQPSDNYARTLMERFTLGSGRYSENDVREAARAFTGWFVFRGELRYIDREHDSGAKRILGQEGEFTGEDVIRIVLQQPAASRLLVRKLYRWLISETSQPDDALIAPLAESFGKSYDVAALVETMLRSNLFFSEEAYRRRVKCPVEFALGIVKALEGIIGTARLGRDLAALGQSLCDPPTVKGWAGGRGWINRFTLVGRSNLALALLAGSDSYGNKLDPLVVAEKHGFGTPELRRQFLIDLFLQGDVGKGVREALVKTVARSASPAGSDARLFAHLVVTLPEFHLA